MKLASSFVGVASLVLATRTASASKGQFHLGPALGFGWRSDSHGGVGGFGAVDAAYDLSDAFRLYASAGYLLSSANDSATTPRQEGNLAAGLVYVIDVLRVVPWAGIGLQGALVWSPTLGAMFVPGIQARAGLDYLVSRDFALSLHLSYELSLTNGAPTSGFNASVGVRWTFEP